MESIALYTHSLEFILGLLVNFVQSYVMFEVSVCFQMNEMYKATVLSSNSACKWPMRRRSFKL